MTNLRSCRFSPRPDTQLQMCCGQPSTNHKLMLPSLTPEAFNYPLACTISVVEADRPKAHLDALINLKNYEAIPVTEV